DYYKRKNQLVLGINGEWEIGLLSDKNHYYNIVDCGYIRNSQTQFFCRRSVGIYTFDIGTCHCMVIH
ncbi:MAG: hypothetical protein NZ825_15660, partial [Candidatus Marinimicrobia bacterium]|nr:hypothetical protein [Candidatus Neomarinimicrobiota bacterium]